MPSPNNDNTSQLRAQAFEAVRAFFVLPLGGREYRVAELAIEMLGAIASYMYNDADTLHIDCERRTAERHALGNIADSAPDFMEMVHAAKAALAVRDVPVSERPYAQRQEDADGVLWYDPFLKPGEDFPLETQAWNELARACAARKRGDKAAALAHIDAARRLGEKWEQSGLAFADIDASHFIGHCQHELAKLEGGAE